MQQRALGEEIAGFVRKARSEGYTAVVKVFMIPTPELRRTRCELCGSTMEVNLRGVSRPVCWKPGCFANAMPRRQPTCLYWVLPGESAEE